MATPNVEGIIRKTRSTGDIPRVPERVHIASHMHSDSNPQHSDTRLPASDIPSASTLLVSPLSDSSHSYTLPSPPPATLPNGHEQPDSHTMHIQRSEPQAVQEAPNTAPDTRHTGSFYLRWSSFLGLGRNAPPDRKALVNFIWSTCWHSIQIPLIVTMLILVSVHYKSPLDPSISEWKACNRPLGTWATIWVVRNVLSMGLTTWEFKRGRQARAMRVDVETNPQHPFPVGPDGRHEQRNIAAREPNIHGSNQLNATGTSSNHQALAHSPLYARLTLLNSLMTLSWFLTAHILEYSSIHTCRHTSPHLWWLVFGILCILYLMVLEVVVLGIIVLIIAPILFIFWNILLMCLGRHPIQNPIKPEITGLPKSVVERIPLVMYIPPPPEDEKSGTQVVPHVYPPKNLQEQKPPQQTRFKLLRKFRSSKSKNEQDVNEKNGTPIAEPDNKVADDDEPLSWEDNWERSDYPFVALEGNRAACAICLLDFEEPRRKIPLPTESGGNGEEVKLETPDQFVASGSNSPVHTHEPISEQHRRGTLKLEDAGEGAQPLRLLACGHVFHKTCLDPWLIDVSGRCPICQRAVEVPTPPKKTRRRRNE